MDVSAADRRHRRTDRRLSAELFLDTAPGGWWFTLFTAVLGSMILLGVLGLVQKKT